MYYAGFKYLDLNNLGDQIQSIAVENLIPPIHIRVNRDTIAIEKLVDRHILIMNGWFTHNPKQCFPPNEMIYPVFWGFHVTNWNNSWDHFLSPRIIKYFKKYEPIGCRDRYTAEMLENVGIYSFYSKCLSLTFPKRSKKIVNGWNIIVDVNYTLLPSFITDNALFVTHNISPNIPEDDKIKQAKNLLSLYKKKAKLVITSRVHCALPCVAMGIPVVFLGNPKDYRTSIVQDIGLKINCVTDFFKYNTDKDVIKQKQLNKFWRNVNWNPKELDYENNKEKIVFGFKSFLNSKLESLN